MKLLIAFGVVCVYQIVTVSSVFFPVPIITGTTSTSSSGQPTTVNTNISFQNVSNITDMVIYLTQNISRALLVSLPTPEDIELVAEILDTFSDGLKSMISESKEDYEENPATGSEWITDESSNKPNFFDDIVKDINSMFQNFAALFNPNFDNQKNKEDTNKNAPVTNKQEENINNQTNSDTEDQTQTTESQTEAINNLIAGTRRKRDLTSSISEILKTSAGLNLATNPLYPSGSVSADSQASFPNLRNIFPMSEIGGDLSNQTLQAMNEGIKQMAEQDAAVQSIAIQNAIQQGKELINQEMEKTKAIQQFVNTSLDKISKLIETLAQKIRDSNCVKQFTSIRNLLSEGITCVKNKFDTGIKTINDTLSNISDALEVPWDIKNEAEKCAENQEANVLSKILCYATIPLKLEENKLFLPIEFGKRIAEAVQFFATLRMDLIRCGIVTIQSIALKAVDCGKEAIIIGKDTILEMI
ncbi:uncharacterized protein LOC129803596 [Phlebotomus papatasi]|uniref:uncharacterized protein LOC129803596 n=1 Tax=Phlebotomus papatasi TaxID=29031 RepID=UPI002484291F|nr:uncharacterized protein LOC129803596 [Phlebotomus papatasi]